MRFATLSSPDKNVRARLQAALYTNRKKNRTRRSQPETSTWGVGFLTIDYDPGNNIYGYSSYVDPIVGSVIHPNPSNPIIYFAADEGSVNIEIQGDVSDLFQGVTLNLDGFTETANSLVQFLGDVTSIIFAPPTNNWNWSSRVGDTVEVSFTFA
jgi:hypothetical protein